MAVPSETSYGDVTREMMEENEAYHAGQSLRFCTQWGQRHGGLRWYRLRLTIAFLSGKAAVLLLLVALIIKPGMQISPELVWNGCTILLGVLTGLSLTGLNFRGWIRYGWWVTLLSGALLYAFVVNSGSGL